jgi:hypothetical protein
VLALIFWEQFFLLYFEACGKNIALSKWRTYHLFVVCGLCTDGERTKTKMKWTK